MSKEIPPISFKKINVSVATAILAGIGVIGWVLSWQNRTAISETKLELVITNDDRQDRSIEKLQNEFDEIQDTQNKIYQEFGKTLSSIETEIRNIKEQISEKKTDILLFKSW